MTISDNVIHAGRDRQGFLLLKKTEDSFCWLRKNGADWVKIGLTALSVKEALQLAQQELQLEGFRLLHCGFRYTLPERDEVGANALFHHMSSSYESMTGVYFDPELGHPCRVDFASQEALDLHRELKGATKW